MERSPPDEEREQRIHMEIIVDAYGPEEQAIGPAEEYRDRLHLIDLLRTRGLALNALGRHGEALTAVERSLALAREIGTPYGEGRALGALSAIQRGCGELADADAAADKATKILRRLGARLE
jgi:tetratricopeptide (TPR) repeat protein